MYASIVIATVNTVKGMGLNTNLQVGIEWGLAQEDRYFNHEV